VWADKALEHFPESPDLLAAKSLALFRMGHENEGRALNDTALEKRGESALVWLARGEIMLRSSRKAAEECFGHALRTADRATDVTLLRIVAVALRNSKYSLALTLLRKAIAARPGTAHAWYLQGVAQDELGLAAEAQRSFREAADLAPGNSLYKAALWRREPGLVTRMARAWRRLLGT
jgi:tetratricopeptide (TPR) repeat protein